MIETRENAATMTVAGITTATYARFNILPSRNVEEDQTDRPRAKKAMAKKTIAKASENGINISTHSSSTHSSNKQQAYANCPGLREEVQDALKLAEQLAVEFHDDDECLSIKFFERGNKENMDFDYTYPGIRAAVNLLESIAANRKKDWQGTFMASLRGHLGRTGCGLHFGKYRVVITKDSRPIRDAQGHNEYEYSSFGLQRCETALYNLPDRKPQNLARPLQRFC